MSSEILREIRINPIIPAESSFHWHLEICPRTSVPNGFELGSGLAINTISPEKAAEQMRSVVF